MAGIKLYWVREEGEDEPHLTDDSSGAYIECVPVKKLTDLDSYDIAGFLDQRAEGENRHELVGAHAKLAKLIRMTATEQDADTVMLAILKAGGLWRLAKA